jgi:hypothetical protein
MANPQRPAAPANDRTQAFFNTLARGGVPQAERQKALAGLKAGRLALVDSIIYQRFQFAAATAVTIDTQIRKLFACGKGDVISELGFTGTTLQTAYHTNLNKGGLLAHGEFFVPNYLGFEFPHNVHGPDVRKLRHCKVRLRPQGGNQTVDMGKLDMFPPLHRYMFEPSPTVPTTGLTGDYALTLPDFSTVGYMHRTMGPAQHIGDRLIIRGTQFANEVDFVELVATETFTINGIDVVSGTDTPLEIEARMYGQYLQVITGK